MRLTTEAAALAAVVCVAATSAVYADSCPALLEEARRKTAETELPDRVRREAAQLRRAARLLANEGQTGRCMEVAQGILELVEKRHELRERTERRDRLGRAPALSQLDGVLSTDAILGTQVRTTSDEEVGAVEDVALDAATGRVRYLVVEIGGILGIGERLVAVPWDAFQFTEDRETLVLDVRMAQLDVLEGFDEETWPERPSAVWRHTLPENAD